MASPIDQDLAFLRVWLSRPNSGDNFLRGLEASIWDPKNDEDLITMTTRPGERDYFTGWVINSVLIRFHRYIGCRIFHNRPEDEEAGYTEYKDSRLLTSWGILVTIISSMLPVLSTIALYLVEGIALRLGMVALFMLIFSSALVIFTNARRVEIFAATAA